MATKWGIASAGKISSDFVTALRLLPSEEHVIVAVAARDKDRAKAFAEKHNIPVFYGSYEELAADKDVEVIYIGMLNPQHISVGQLCLEHGKHILCEKPLGMNLKEVSTLIKVHVKSKDCLCEAFTGGVNVRFWAYRAVRPVLVSVTAFVQVYALKMAIEGMAEMSAINNFRPRPYSAANPNSNIRTVCLHKKKSCS